ncbi:ExbD/TolR family protein [Aquimarina sediminis]|uniref:ExbD/TolR family protein n=1 Tax=Aquimarina sediminis TaxID=2070536 RepID=UPI000CA0754B|nr:biopolymer transporter ExbD [Aquimarina sediminis]
MTRRLVPRVNAGSMADIAFLLLIFFLVSTTIETDYGIGKQLPPIEDVQTDIVIKEKNLLEVRLNQNNEISVDGVKMNISKLKEVVVAFLDNGGGSGNESCEYCRGKHDAISSDNPGRAVISLANSRETNYATYIAVQNELTAAYTKLRNREAKRMYGVSYSEMKSNLQKTRNRDQILELNEKIKAIRSLYPERISEIMPVDSY